MTNRSAANTASPLTSVTGNAVVSRRARSLTTCGGRPTAVGLNEVSVSGTAEPGWRYRRACPCDRVPDRLAIWPARHASHAIRQLPVIAAVDVSVLTDRNRQPEAPGTVPQPTGRILDRGLRLLLRQHRIRRRLDHSRPADTTACLTLAQVCTHSVIQPTLDLSQTGSRPVLARNFRSQSPACSIPSRNWSMSASATFARIARCRRANTRLRLPPPSLTIRPTA